MTVLAREANGDSIPAGHMPSTGSTTSITTAAVASAKTAVALTGGLYRVTSTAEVSIVQGPQASVTAVAGDATLPALPFVEYFGVLDGNGVAVFDAGAGAATVKLTLV